VDEMPYLVRSNVLCSGTINKWYAWNDDEIDQVRNSQVDFVDCSMDVAEEMVERLNAEMRRDFADTNIAFG